MGHNRVNFKYEIISIDLKRMEDYTIARNYFINQDTLGILKVLDEMKNDFNLDQAINSRYTRYNYLIYSEETVDYYVAHYDRVFRNHLDPKVLDDRNYFTDLSLDAMIERLFQYYMNGIDNVLWNEYPYYYLSESLISEEDLESLVERSKEFPIKTGYYDELDTWKEISYEDMNKYFLTQMPENDLDVFFQSYFKECMQKNLTVLIRENLD